MDRRPGVPIGWEHIELSEDELELLRTSGERLAAASLRLAQAYELAERALDAGASVEAAAAASRLTVPMVRALARELTEES